MLKIFIGWDSRFPEPADVLRYSLQKHSSIPLDIYFLKLGELNIQRVHDPLASTEFTYSRFLVPHLCGFRGTALFLDNDMLCFGDIREIAETTMSDCALRVVKHDYQPANTVKMYGAVQTSYPRKNWSSMMLMNCSRLGVWTKQAVETASGAYLHRFQDIPDNLIGDLPNTWNTLDTMDERTRLIHYTNGGPWFDDYKDHPHAAIWFRYRDEMRAAKGRPAPAPQRAPIGPGAMPITPVSMPAR